MHKSVAAAHSQLACALCSAGNGGGRRRSTFTGDTSLEEGVLFSQTTTQLSGYQSVTLSRFMSVSVQVKR